MNKNINPPTKPLNLPTVQIGWLELGDILEKSLQPILNLTSIFSVAGYLAIAYLLAIRNVILVPLLLLPLLVAILAATFRRDLPYAVRVIILIGFYLLIGSGMLFMWGINPVGIIILVMAVQGTFFLWGATPGRVMLAVSTISILGFGIIHQTGWIKTIGISPATVSIQEVVLTIAGFVLVNLFLAITAGNLLNGLNQTVKTERELTQALAYERSNLESRIEERTRQLTRQTRLMELAAEIAHQISLETSREKLFHNTIHLIRERLGYYHAGIFLMDEQDEYAVLVSALGEAGEKMLAQNHRLKKGEEGIVGYVVYRGQARIALDVGKDAVHFKNPLLPLTRSEMALPIKTGDRVLGALDIQSTEAEAFTDIDVQSLQVIADQLAVALDRIRLFEELRQTVENLESSTRASTRKTWRIHLRSTSLSRGFRYTPAQKKIEAIDADATLVSTEDLRQAIRIPLLIRGEVIGTLNVQFDSSQAPKETVRLLETTAERIGQALETARLLEELEIRAERERLVTDLSTQVRSSTDLDQILRTTAVQLSQSLGLSDVLVQILPPAKTPSVDSPVEAA